ncbi:hypothetical protein PJL18_02501 [Paenarthrobacter nicotinovorans]|nr:hypothetical protein [Paenarthrobacter nicotinovorans]
MNKSQGEFSRRQKQSIQARSAHTGGGAGVRQLCEGRTGGGHGDLLTDHRPDQQFLGIHRAGNPDTGNGRDSAGQTGVYGKGVIDRLRIGVEVEQSPDPAQQCGEVVEIQGVDRQLQGLSTGFRVEGDREGCVASRQAQGACVAPGSVRRGVRRLDAGNCAYCQEVEDSGVERFPIGQVQCQRRGRGLRNPGTTAQAGLRPGGAQRRRGHSEHFTDGVVELAHAVEPGSECDICQKHVRRDQQGPGRLRSACPCKGERARAQFMAEDAVEMAG